MTNPSDRKSDIIGWEITNQCNLSCAHCFTAAGKRAHKELTTEECRGLIDAMAAIGVRMIGWTGGEPLLRSDLEELTIYAWQQGIKCNVTTNGVLLDVARAASLMSAGIRTFQISLDGSSALASHRMRGTTDSEYDRIIEAIRLCKRNNARVFLATLIGQENLDDARQMIELGKREQVDAIRFCCYTPVGRGRHAAVRDRLYFSERLGELLRFIDEAQADPAMVVTFDVGFGPTPGDFGFHTCTAGIETFYLKANGDVYPCTALVDRRFLVGNVRTRPLEEIWQLPQMWAMSEFPREDIRGHCQACDNFANCRGACRGSTLAHTDDLTASFPVCLYRVAVEQQAAKRV